MKLSGKVVKGQGFATLAFGLPTANIVFAEIISLEPGTYAGYTVIGKKRYASVLYVGPKGTEKFEDHLFDFNEEIYGRTLEIEVLDLVCPHVSWESEEQMQAKVEADVQAVRKYFTTRSSSAS